MLIFVGNEVEVVNKKILYVIDLSQIADFPTDNLINKYITSLYQIIFKKESTVRLQSPTTLET